MLHTSCYRPPRLGFPKLCLNIRHKILNKRSSFVLLTLIIAALIACFHFSRNLSPVIDLELKNVLHDKYGLPWVIVEHMDSHALQLCLANVRKSTTSRRGAQGDEKSAHSPFLIIHVQNGLCNRLRALTSAISFANKTGRLPIIIWKKNVHLDAHYDDLIDSTALEYPLLNDFASDGQFVQSLSADDAWDHFDRYFYLYSQPEINTTSSRSIYFNSATVMTTALNDWESENAWIKTVPWRHDIVEMANTVLSQGVDAVGGAHIRNRTVEHDIVGLEDGTKLYSKNSTHVVDRWRATSTMENFIPTMSEMIESGKVSRFFVASDTIEVCRQLQRQLGRERILFIDRDCDDRGAKCVKYAMADLLVLSKLGMLLGSSYSSFTIMVGRLGGPGPLLSGTQTLIEHYDTYERSVCNY